MKKGRANKANHSSNSNLSNDGNQAVQPKKLIYKPRPTQGHIVPSTNANEKDLKPHTIGFQNQLQRARTGTHAKKKELEVLKEHQHKADSSKDQVLVIDETHIHQPFQNNDLLTALMDDRILSTDHRTSGIGYGDHGQPLTMTHGITVKSQRIHFSPSQAKITRKSPSAKHGSSNNTHNLQPSPILGQSSSTYASALLTKQNSSSQPNQSRIPQGSPPRELLTAHSKHLKHEPQTTKSGVRRQIGDYFQNMKGPPHRQSQGQHPEPLRIQRKTKAHRHPQKKEPASVADPTQDASVVDVRLMTYEHHEASDKHIKFQQALKPHQNKGGVLQKDVVAREINFQNKMSKDDHSSDQQSPFDTHLTSRQFDEFPDNAEEEDDDVRTNNIKMISSDLKIHESNFLRKRHNDNIDNRNAILGGFGRSYKFMNPQDMHATWDNQVSCNTIEAHEVPHSFNSPVQLSRAASRDDLFSHCASNQTKNKSAERANFAAPSMPQVDFTKTISQVHQSVQTEDENTSPNMSSGGKQPKEFNVTEVSEASKFSQVKASILGKIGTIFQSPMPKQKEPSYICDCPRHPEYHFVCSNAYNWYMATLKSSRVTDINYPKLKQQYKQLLNASSEFTEKETLTQIHRDLHRTFPKVEYFKETSKGLSKLKKVLIAFANYDKQVDYVQGMNFIVGALLMHCSEVMAFWLFVSLLEDCEMRDIYLPGLPGLYKHSQLVEMLVMDNLNDLFKHFVSRPLTGKAGHLQLLQAYHNIRVEMYASKWIFSLFSSVVPLEHMHLVFNQFYDHQWIFFYQMVLSLLKILEKELLAEDELANILCQISTTNKPLFSREQEHNDPNRSPNKLDNHSSLEQGVDTDSRLFGLLKKVFHRTEKNIWVTVIDNSTKEWKLNDHYINHMLQHYDPVNQRFNLPPSMQC